MGRGFREQARAGGGASAKVPANDSLGPDAAFQRGIALIQGENFDEAAKHFPSMLRQFREHEKLPLIVYYAGLSATKKEDWDTASNYFKEVTEKHPKSELADQALYEWAWAQRARKRDKEATALYEKLLADHPQSPLVIKVQSEMAELNLDVGAQEKVIAELTETLESMEDEALREPIRIQLASAHYKKGDYQVSAEMFEKLLNDYPESKLRGSMLFKRGSRGSGSRKPFLPVTTLRPHRKFATWTMPWPSRLSCVSGKHKLLRGSKGSDQDLREFPFSFQGKSMDPECQVRARLRPREQRQAK